MTKEHILAEIKRVAAEKNNGVAPGQHMLFREAGIKDSDWRRKHWAKWSDAIREAGFSPNEMQGAYNSDFLIEKLVQLARELKRVPTFDDIYLKRRTDEEFPSYGAYRRLGSKAELVSAMESYCKTRKGFADIIEFCAAVKEKAILVAELGPDEAEYGYVYLLKGSGYYKIGKSNAPGRRERELAIQLPEPASIVHKIRTDDPQGIEAYWHHRFKAKRKHGEWFDLSSAEVNAFKRRKFM